VGKWQGYSCRSQDALLENRKSSKCWENSKQSARCCKWCVCKRKGDVGEEKICLYTFPAYTQNMYKKLEITLVAGAGWRKTFFW
jgi:hypothetical protein